MTKLNQIIAYRNEMNRYYQYAKAKGFSIINVEKLCMIRNDAGKRKECVVEFNGKEWEVTYFNQYGEVTKTFTKKGMLYSVLKNTL